MRILTALLIAALVAACGRPHPVAENLRTVKVITAASDGMVDKDFAGMATPDDAVNLAFKVPGQLQEVPISDGRSVAKGQLLAEIDPRDIQLQIAADRSAYEQARSQLARMERLLQHEAVSQQDYENARTRFAQAKAAYDNTSDLLKQTKLRAPFAGVIERSYVDNFERVQAGQTIARLVNPVSTTVKFTLPESGLPLLTEGKAHFTVEFDNYRGVLFAARVREYVRTSSDASGFPVTLTLTDTDPARYRLSPGMSCVVRMQSPDPEPDAVSLPLSAIFAPADGGNYVWVVDRDDRVERRAVSLGELFSKNRVLVQKGILPGERVVTAGVYQLREGERVRILN